MRAMIEAIESRPKPAPTTEAAELDRLIAEQKAELSRVIAGLAAEPKHTETDTEINDLGAFG